MTEHQKSAATEDLIEKAARKALRLEGDHNDDYVASLREGTQSPREEGRWHVATHAARMALVLMKEADVAPDVRHKKRGTSYTVLGDLEIQTSAPLKEGDVVTGYQCCETGKLWARPVEEFEDGRFEKIEEKK